MTFDDRWQESQCRFAALLAREIPRADEGLSPSEQAALMVRAFALLAPTLTPGILALLRTEEPYG